MEWTKIKSQHFLFNEMSLIEHGALARLLCLTAHLERLPTEREMSRHVTQATRKHLARTLQASSNTLAGVLSKVLDDVEGVKHKRAVSRKTTKTYRDKQSSFPQACDVSRDTIDKIREDKIREDNKTQPSLRDDICKKVYDHGLNIYALINRINNARQSTHPIPDAVIIDVCNKYLADPDAVKNQWAWFNHVLNISIDMYNANQRIAEHKAVKDAPVAQCISDLIKGV